MIAWLDISATEGGGNVNNCYTFHDFDSTWNEARDACCEMGAHLVTMETTDEWNKVKGFVAEEVKETGSYTNYYIGFRKEDGTWKWTEAGSVSLVSLWPQMTAAESAVTPLQVPR